MRNLMRGVILVILLLIVAFVLYMCSTQDDVPTEATGEPTNLVPDNPPAMPRQAEPEPEPDPVDETPAADIAEEPDTIMLVEPAIDPAECTYPGDGFTPHPAGFTPSPGQYIEFEYPTYRSGYNGEPLVNPGADADLAGQTVCVVLTYDVSAAGTPVNIQTYDSDMALDYGYDVPIDVYEQEAISALKTRRYNPGQRNGKPVRIDQNVMEIRFAAAE